MKYLPTSDADRKEMLAAIGVSSVDELFAAVPASVRQSPNLPPPLSEIEIRRLLRSLAKRNANARESAFFLGADLYHHYTSAIADQMLYRSEWLTAYTPYQPEVSQGTLQFDLRVPDPHLPADRSGCRQRLPLRRGLGVG